MERKMFVRLATIVLAQHGVGNPEAKAEAIAAKMDELQTILGNAGPEPAAPSAPPAPRPAFPAANPEAVVPVPVPDMPVYEAEPVDTAFEPLPAVAPEPAQAPLIVTDTRMPDPEERAAYAAARTPRNPEPLRSLRQPPARLKVEELSALVQKNTPERLQLNVPNTDGTTIRAIFQRDVISMHAFDSVRVVLYPPNASPSVREVAEVQKILHVDDAPFDFPAILNELARQAADSIRPRRPIVSVPPPPASGPVQPSKPYADGSPATVNDPTTLNQTQAVFGSLG
jgi:hypothetical protein